MLFKEPSQEVKPLLPQEAAQLKKLLQNAALDLEKGKFDSKPLEKIVHRLLSVRNDLIIDEDADCPRLAQIVEGQKQILINNLKKMEELFVYDKQMGHDDNHEAILNLFPSDMIGEAFVHAVHAVYRLEELQREKDRRTQERAFNNFLHIIHCFNILEDSQKALKTLKKRQEQYQKQIEAHQRNIENSLAKKQNFDIPRSEEKIRHFEAKIDWIQLHIAALTL